MIENPTREADFCHVYMLILIPLSFKTSLSSASSVGVIARLFPKAIVDGLSGWRVGMRGGEASAVAMESLDLKSGS
jgi:hypothetical protein